MRFSSALREPGEHSADAARSGVRRGSRPWPDRATRIQRPSIKWVSSSMREPLATLSGDGGIPSCAPFPGLRRCSPGSRPQPAESDWSFRTVPPLEIPFWSRGNIPPPGPCPTARPPGPGNSGCALSTAPFLLDLPSRTSSTLHPSLFHRQQNVGRLQVAVDDPFAVCHVNGTREGLEERGRLGRTPGLAVQ